MFTTIGVIIEIAIVVLAVVFGIIGIKKGFLKSLISLFSWGVCLSVAFFLAKYVAGWINGIHNFSADIGSNIAGGLNGTNELFTRAINSFENQNEIKSAIQGLNINGLLKQLCVIVFSNANVNMESTATIASVVGASLGQIIMVMIAGVLTFVVLKILVALLSKLFDKIAQTKILGGLNKILGAVFGVAKAAVIVFVLNALLVALSLIPAVNNTIHPIIQDHTYVERFVYNKTDELVEEYIINGQVVQNWINDVWASRG